MSSRWCEGGGPRGDDYDRRFDALAATGHDVHGEASFVERLLPRPASVLDAGCGTGRVAIELARRGMDVVGVDLDPGMLDAARRKAPGGVWVEADLSELDLGRTFDVVVAAGNVVIFLAPGSEPTVVGRLALHLVPGGRLVAGFQLTAGRYDLASYDAHAAAAGLHLVDRFSTWDGDEFVADGAGYAVSVHARPG